MKKKLERGGEEVISEEIDLRMEYELLRDNARGITNQSRGLCIFLQQGMIGWIKFLNYHLQKSPTHLLPRNTGDTLMFHKQELASNLHGVLTDILFPFNSQQK